MNITQCVFPRLNIEQYISDKAYRTEIQTLTKIGVGGFCVFGGTIESVAQTIDELQFLADEPLLFCADFENGLPMRLSEGGTAFPHHAALARAYVRNHNYTHDAALAIAKEARSIGILWNLAPVCDINYNPQNPVINIRAFADDYSIVSKNAVEYIRGTRAANVATCVKHFPGHGNVAIDSHTQIPSATYSKRQDEWRPFATAMYHKADAVMLGHIDPTSPHAPGLDIWQKNIRRLKEMHIYGWWEGLIVTDALDMQAIIDAEAAGKFCRKKYQHKGTDHRLNPNSHIGDAAVCAFAAGAHVLLMPAQPMIAIEALKHELNLAGARWHVHLAKALQKIRSVKEFVGLLPKGEPQDCPPPPFSEHMRLALKIARDACDIWGSHQEKCLPLPEDIPIAVFNILQKAEDLQAGSRFFTMLGQAIENDLDMAYLDEDITAEQLELMVDNIEYAEMLIFALFYKGRGYSNRLGNPEKLTEIIRTLSAGRPAIVIHFGDPYIADELPGHVKILTYSDSMPSLAAAVAVLAGRAV